MLLVDYAFPNFASADMWLSLLTLTFLEIVLGVDNIIFVSIVANQLPPKERPKARNYGLLLALLFRVLLLLGIGWILSLSDPIFTLSFIKDHGMPIGISVKDLILMGGGLFLLYKSTQEIHEKLEGHAQEVKTKKGISMTNVIVQICLVNIVFSFDSILTAIGMTQDVVVMMIAVVASIIVMMLFSNAVSSFINKHPTMQMLALSFLILIGVMLIVEGLHQHVSKGYIYFAIAFSMGVELLNMNLRKKSQKDHVVHLNPEIKEVRQSDGITE